MMRIAAPLIVAALGVLASCAAPRQEPTEAAVEPSTRTVTKRLSVPVGRTHRARTIRYVAPKPSERGVVEASAGSDTDRAGLYEPRRARLGFRHN